MPKKNQFLGALDGSVLVPSFKSSLTSEALSFSPVRPLLLPTDSSVYSYIRSLRSTFCRHLFDANHKH